jgi:hypothetical protein
MRQYKKSPLTQRFFFDCTNRSHLQKYFGRRMRICGAEQGRCTKIRCTRTNTAKKKSCAWRQDGPTLFNVAISGLGHILWLCWLDLTFIVDRLDNLVSLTGVTYHHRDFLYYIVKC